MLIASFLLRSGSMSPYDPPSFDAPSTWAGPSARPGSPYPAKNPGEIGVRPQHVPERLSDRPGQRAFSAPYAQCF